MDRGTADAPFAQFDPGAGREDDVDEPNLVELGEDLSRLPLTGNTSPRTDTNGYGSESKDMKALIFPTMAAAIS